MGLLRAGLVVVRVQLGVLLPLVRELVLGEAGIHRAGLDAGIAVDALVGVDVEHLDLVVIRLVGRRMDAVDRTDLDARVVLLADAGLRDDVCHVVWLLLSGTTAAASYPPRSPGPRPVRSPDGDHPRGCRTSGGTGPERVILLTGATGNVGSAVLRRLTASGERVRCLVRDPRRLGAERVRVQIALGDLSDPGSFRNAMRGVKTVIHLAAAIRDQPRGSIEELNGVATYRLVHAAERAGAERFIFFSAIGASLHAPMRFFRAKALAEQAVENSSVPSTIFAPSIVYSPHDYWVGLMERLTLLPAVPISGSGRARYQPIWAEDVVDCVLSALERDGDGRGHYDLAGPETLTYDDVARTILRSLGRRRRLL